VTTRKLSLLRLKTPLRSLNTLTTVRRDVLAVDLTLTETCQLNKSLTAP